MSDPFAHLKENRWREVAEIDHRFERGEIDDEQWHRAMAQLVVPAYLAADTPWEQSGKTGSRADWVGARSLVGDAIERDGSILVPSSRRRDLVEHLLALCERLVVGVFNEHESEDTTAELLRGYGFAPAGRARRSHPEKHGMDYRIVWLDA